MKSPYSTIMFLCVILCASRFAFSQTPSRLIEWQLKPMGSNSERWTGGVQLFKLLDRVELEDVTVGNSITIGQSFKADDDWLKEIIFRVRNVSGQRVAAIQITLILPQMGLSSPDIIYCYGCAPAEKAKGISAGESVELKMLAGYYDFVKSSVAEKGGISQISKAQIREMFVTLPDGTSWVSGCVKTAEAKDACLRAAP